jgi:hypothetical protein
MCLSHLLSRGPPGSFESNAIADSLCAQENENRYRGKTDSDDEGKEDGCHLDHRHVFGMIGAEGLERAPETVFYVKADYDKGKHIKRSIKGIPERRCNHSIQTAAGSCVHKGKSKEVYDHKAENLQARVGLKP